MAGQRPRGRPRGANYPTASNKRKLKRQVSSSSEEEDNEEMSENSDESKS
jgi:hypothetical protein